MLEKKAFELFSLIIGKTKKIGLRDYFKVCNITAYSKIKDNYMQ